MARGGSEVTYDPEILQAEILKLRKALSELIPWAGESPSGPSWATDDAKARNKAEFERALAAACDCFPVEFNGKDMNFHERSKL